LIDAANRLFQGSGVTFSLKEVRTDVAKYPYLLQKDKAAWLSCSHNAAATAAGLACLQGIAKDPDVAALATQQHVINVLVSGSDGRTDYTYCSATAADPKPPCRTTSRGYTAARGPWFLGSTDPAWSEDAAEANWLFLSWGNFDTANLNRGPWNGGGATLAHELGCVGRRHGSACRGGVTLLTCFACYMLSHFTTGSLLWVQHCQRCNCCPCMLALLASAAAVKSLQHVSCAFLVCELG
jgi:hypothetical protein